MTDAPAPVALITGGASGLGAAIGATLAADGARVVFADLDLVRAGARAKAAGGSSCAIELDVCRPEDWQRVIQEVEDLFARLDILVNAAGIAPVASIADCSFEEWRRVMAVNVDGTFLGCKTVLPLMEKSGGGAIVNLGSVSGLVGGHNLAAYNASKGAVRMLTKSVALHCARQGKGVRCNSVHPAFVRTPMIDPMLESAGEHKLARQIPAGRVIEAQEVADLVRFLVSPSAEMITGADYVIDGGLTA